MWKLSVSRVEVSEDMNIIAYEMKYAGGEAPSELAMIPFDEQYAREYMQIYNECFFEMRRALEVKPYHYYQSEEQLAERKDDIFLYMQDGEIIGSFVLCDKEIDDLIVNPKYQGQGYGKKLLHTALAMMQEKKVTPIILHVAAWNERALHLYETNGFESTLAIKVRHDKPTRLQELKQWFTRVFG